MSAQPRSDHRVDQGEDLKKGNIQTTPRSTSIRIGTWHRGTRGSTAARHRSPHFSLLFASGTRPRRRPRVHGTRGAHARSAAAYKRPTGGILLRRRWARMAAKKKAGGKKKAAKKSSKKK